MCSPRIDCLVHEKMFFGPLRDSDRSYIMAICFNNGISPNTLNMVYLNPNASPIIAKKITDLYSYWSAAVERRRGLYWAYVIILGRICDLNGNITSAEGIVAPADNKGVVQVAADRDSID